MAVRPFKKLEEFQIWSVGPLQTTHGDDCVITPQLLMNTQQHIESLGRRLSIDIHHIASDETISPENRKSFASFKTELRNDSSELWARDILWNTKQIEQDASAGFYGNYISQEFTGINSEGRPDADLKNAVLFDLNRVTLTDDPATINAKPLVALSKDGKKSTSSDTQKRSLTKKFSVTPLLDDSKRIEYTSGKANSAEVKKMDPKFIEALQAAVGQLNAVINSIGQKPGPEVEVELEEEEVPEDEGAKKLEEEDESKKMSSTPGQAAASVVAAGEEEKKSNEEEEEDEAKKMEVPSVSVPQGNPESTSVDEKRLAKFVKEMFPGMSADQIEGQLFTLESTAKKVCEATKKAADVKKLSREAQRSANFEVAVSRGILSPLDEQAVKRFKNLSTGAQKAAIDSAPSFFTKKVTPDMQAATELAAKALSRGSKEVIKCKLPWDTK